MVGELIAGRYELEELVGRGGMSSVYRAHDRLLERTVALKILHEHHTRDDDYVERFRREARAVAQLSHPNIVTVIDRGEQDGRQFIVFQYIDGETLKDVVERRGPLPVAEAVRLGVQIAGALAFAHERGVVHRDVKPQNVLFDGDGRAKVTDFGIARSRDTAGMTLAGTVMGTSHYIPPEQARGDVVDERSDVYSLGAVLYELLTGEVPFAGDNFVAVAMRHMNEEPPSARARRPDVPPRLDLALRRAMAKEPADRPSMKELVGELEAALADPNGRADGDVTMIIPPRQQAAPRTARRRRRWSPVVLAVLVLVGGAVAAVFIVRSASDENREPVRPPTPPPRSEPVALRGIASYDPESADRREHPERVRLATDGEPTTYWTTETYEQWVKSGVGLVLDAGRAVEPEQLTVTTDQPGFTAEIHAGSEAGGPFTRVSPRRTVNGRTAFPLRLAEPTRYFVVWITDPGPRGVARVNEVEPQ